MRGIVGSVLVAIGGALLFVALYLVLYTALYQYFNPTAGMAGALLFGLFGFGLLAYGFFLVIKSDVSSK
jgi:tetrahydromethanopterin S-methyltransferase subunit D